LERLEVVMLRGGGLEVMMERVLLAVSELVSVTSTVKLYVAAVVGVPDMAPVLPRVVPVGRVPSVSFHV
jgi:hypothetical protein